MSAPQPEILPSPLLYSQWINVDHCKPEWLPSITQEAGRCCKASGWNPKIVRLEGDIHMVDLCMAPDSDEPHSIHVAALHNHPFLATLDALPNVPRAVKAIYRKSTRTKYLRMTDTCGYLRDQDAADKAWSVYRRNMRNIG